MAGLTRSDGSSQRLSTSHGQPDQLEGMSRGIRAVIIPNFTTFLNDRLPTESVRIQRRRRLDRALSRADISVQSICVRSW